MGVDIISDNFVVYPGSQGGIKSVVITLKHE